MILDYVSVACGRDLKPSRVFHAMAKQLAIVGVNVARTFGVRI